MVVVSVHGAVSSAVSESDTTTFWISLLRRPVSRWMSATSGLAATAGDTSGLAATAGDTSGLSATAGQYPFRPMNVVAPSSSVSADRRRSRLCSSKNPSIGRP
jgi:hypothetical protein